MGAGVAQPVERRAVNPVVGGSSPGSGLATGRESSPRRHLLIKRNFAILDFTIYKVMKRETDFLVAIAHFNNKY